MPLLLGGIVMWSGAIQDIPDSWALCDGTNGTLDLRNRFIVGAGDLYTVNTTGGSADSVLISHSHSASTNASPNHSHSAGTHFGSAINRVRFGGPQIGGRGTSSNGAHSHTSTSDTLGESGTDKNLPPYYALAFIQQVE